MLASRCTWLVSLTLCTLAAGGCAAGSTVSADQEPVAAQGGGTAGGDASAAGGGTNITTRGNATGGGGAKGCTSGADCDDGIDCTADVCVDGACVSTPSDVVCDDGLYCTGLETCDPVLGCVAAKSPCDDNVTCTQDTCDEQSQTCDHTPDDNVCDDGLYCNGAEVCDPQGGCQSGAAPCDDGVGCTVDGCDEDSDSCQHSPDDKACDDTLFCNGVEQCDAQAGCQAGQSPCDDGVSCSVDSCDDSTDTCQHSPDDKACDDGLYCNGSEKCDAQAGCQPGSNPCDDQAPCTVDSCDEQADGCLHQPNDKLCDDGLYCTGMEFCNVMTLQCDTTGPPTCDDAVPCTSDFCDENADGCKSVAVNANCDDGKFCNGIETCDAQKGCQPGSPPVCDDGVPCTADGCDDQQKKCVFTPQNVACDDGLYCNGAETCDAILGCQQGVAVKCDDGLDCTADSCDEQGDACVALANHAYCDDGLYCTGIETCDPNAAPPGSGCVQGPAVQCAGDQIACTDDTCSENPPGCSTMANNANCQPGELCVPGLDSQCQSPPCDGCVAATPCTMDAQCDDNDACNGAETCDKLFNVCQQGSPVDCNDNIGCTVDSCNPVGGACSHAPNHAACSDGFACNGEESCDPTKGCVLGSPVDCNDNIACTVDSCVDPGGSCLHNPMNQLCDDSVFCNGVETCDANLGCQPGTPPSCNDNVACTTDGCDANLDKCVNTVDDGACPCGQSCDAKLGCGSFCNVTACQGKVYQCGDCVDNDNDCDVDMNDAECLGPCDNNEQGYDPEIPGGNSAPCKQDCYYDGDSGAGNDDCYWTHECDPLEVASNYDPEGAQCQYNPNANTPGTSKSCSELLQAQSQTCLAVCGPLAPNGCDCFGCCDIPGLDHDIWLGSADANGNPSCTSEVLADPTKCRPCTITPGCYNPCAECEICLGKPELPAQCLCQECGADVQLCGPPCGTPCPFGYFCNTGCCVPAL